MQQVKQIKNLFTFHFTLFASEKGFTLIEVLISMVLMVGVGFLITTFTLDITNFGLFLGDNLESQQELQQTLLPFIGEVRGMGPADTGAYPIALAATSSFTFYSDLDGNGKFEQVRYFMSNKTLQRGVTVSTGNPAQYLPVNEKVSDVVHYVIVPPTGLLSYYGPTVTGVEPPLAFPVNPSLVRMIKITVTVDRDQIKPPGPVTYSINATMRNLRTE